MTTRSTIDPSQTGAAHPAATVKRTRCPVCLRATASCICRWISAIPHTVEVLILQHPLEVHNAKGSARLLHLSLPNSRMLTGEQFALAILAGLLADKHNVLLYPDTPGDRSLGIAPPPALDAAVREYLLLRDYPGNVRELRQTVTHLGRQTRALAHKVQANAIFFELRHLARQRHRQQFHEARDLIDRTVPVFG